MSRSEEKLVLECDGYDEDTITVTDVRNSRTGTFPNGYVDIQCDTDDGESAFVELTRPKLAKLTEHLTHLLSTWPPEVPNA